MRTKLPRAKRPWSNARFRGFVLLTAFCLSIVLTGCGTNSTFISNKIIDGEGFQMDYSSLNQREDTTLILAEGDALQVVISHENGSVDVTVGKDGVSPIYEGNRLVDITFTLSITESGHYQISVTGHKARGSVAFTKIPAAAETDECDADQTAAYAAYQFALQQIAFEHSYPDGTVFILTRNGARLPKNHSKNSNLRI